VILYAITDRGVFSQKGAVEAGEGKAHLVRRCSELAAAGIDFIQLREKDLPREGLVALGRAMLAAIRVAGGHTRLLLNASCVDDVRAAVSIGADGVHLTSRAEVSPDEIKTIYGEGGFAAPFVSVSCHTLGEVERARGVSAILFGPVFGKTVEGEQVVEGVGLERLAEACRQAGSVPVLALGGVTEANAANCIVAGAAGIAGIRMFMLKDDR
jgi:thiamine-phosphate pyrophosphorylase